VARAGERTGVGLLETGDEPQQRRLPVAVAADDADPVARSDTERDVVQDGARGVALPDAVEVDEAARDRPILCWPHDPARVHHPGELAVRRSAVEAPGGDGHRPPRVRGARLL